MAKATNSKLVNIYKEMFGKHSLSLKEIESKIVRIGIDTQIIAKNAVVLPAMAKDMSIMRLNMQKLVKLMGGTPSMKASSFFKDASAKEALYEEQRKKAAGNLSPTPLKADEGIGGKGGFLSGFLGTILKAILAAGILGTLFNSLDEETKQSIRDFFRKMLIGFFNGITTTFQEISKLLKDPEVKKAFENALQAIFNTIKDGFKLLWETQIDTPLGKHNIFTIMGGVILAFVGLKAAILLMASFVYKLARGLGGLLGGALLGGGKRPGKSPGRPGPGKGVPIKGGKWALLAAAAALAGWTLKKFLEVYKINPADVDEDDDANVAGLDLDNPTEPEPNPEEDERAFTSDNAIDAAVAGVSVAAGASQVKRIVTATGRAHMSPGGKISVQGFDDNKFIKKTKWTRFMEFVAKRNKGLWAKFATRLATVSLLATVPIAGWFLAAVNLGFGFWGAYELFQLWREFNNEPEEKQSEEASSSEPVDADDYLRQQVERARTPTPAAAPDAAPAAAPAAAPWRLDPGDRGPDAAPAAALSPTPAAAPWRLDPGDRGPDAAPAAALSPTPAAAPWRLDPGDRGPDAAPAAAPATPTGINPPEPWTRFSPARIPPSGVNEDLINYLKRTENEPLFKGKIKTSKAKWDEKQWSIGYGTKSTEGEVIDEAEADKRLREAASKFYRYVIDYEKKAGYIWNEPQRQALTSFTYNLGSLDQLTDKGKRTNEEIAKKLPEYNKMGKPLRPHKGLTKRRLYEQALFRSDSSGGLAPNSAPTPAAASAVSHPNLNFLESGPAARPPRLDDWSGATAIEPTLEQTDSDKMGGALSSIIKSLKEMENEFKMAIEKGKKEEGNVIVDNSQRNTTTSTLAQTVASAYDSELFKALEASVYILGSR